jgi:hypothetical protein
VSPARALARALVPLILHLAAREVDRAVGLLLHTTLDLPGLVPQALRLVEPGEALARVAAGTAAGLACVAALALRRAGKAGGFTRALAAESSWLAPLLLRPALSVVALLSLALRPVFPYAFTLPVALTQDWGPAQDAAALAAMLALRVPVPRLPVPRAGEVAFLAFLAYALLVPGWARTWDGHPGNEPKYLRMALALGHRLSLDVDGIDAPMEELPVQALASAAPAAAGALVAESGRMLAALAHGPQAVGRDAIRASRVTRQTILGKDGGVFHVLAPGPSLLLAPTLRLDRAINRAAGTAGRLGVTLLAWNAMAAVLVAALFLLLRDATGQPGLAALLAGFVALVPPFLFYGFQFYPEMPAALLITLSLRMLLYGRRWDAGTMLLLGSALAGLPWLHQKFLPIWGVLAAWSLVVAVGRLVTARAFFALLVPQAASAYLTMLYNFAITGSVRPDAMFLAWGPAGITTEHLGQGFLGLLLDQRYGILPYAPLYLLAAGGVLLPGRRAARLRLALPAALAYYMTVASADDWHGAVSNLGRYFMPIAPLVVAFAGLALASAPGRGVVAVALALSGWTGLHALALFRDPHAANEAVRWLDASTYADGRLYVPDLFIRSFGEGAPGLFARLLAWGALSLALAAWLRRAAVRGSGRSPRRALAGLALSLLVAGAVLERWPTPWRWPRFRNRIELRTGLDVFVSGAGHVQGRSVLADAGSVELLVRSREPLDQLTLIATGQGQVSIPRQPGLLATPEGGRARLPLQPLASLEGVRGARESLSRQSVRVSTPGRVALQLEMPGTAQ